jgi:hypothetical protein
MNKRSIIEAWAAKCQVADRAGPSYKLIMEGALLTAMQRAIPEPPNPGKGVSQVTIHWDYIDAPVCVDYEPETHTIGSVYANGIDIGLLVSTLPRGEQMAIADACSAELDEIAADESHCAAMDRAEERAAA